MTTGNLLYLLMSMGVFAAFSATLAYQSWQQGKRGAETLRAAAADTSRHQPERHDDTAALTA